MATIASPRSTERRSGRKTAFVALLALLALAGTFVLGVFTAPAMAPTMGMQPPAAATAVPPPIGVNVSASPARPFKDGLTEEHDVFFRYSGQPLEKTDMTYFTMTGPDGIGDLTRLRTDSVTYDWPRHAQAYDVSVTAIVYDKDHKEKARSAPFTFTIAPLPK